MGRKRKNSGGSRTEFDVYAVAEKEDADPTDLPLSYDVTDPDYLKQAIETTSTPVNSRFQHDGYTTIVGREEDGGQLETAIGRSRADL